MPVIKTTIRKADSSDAKAMAICVAAAYRHFIDRIGKPPGPMLDDYAAVVRNHQAFVAEYGGETVGVMVLIQTPDNLLLDNIAVHPGFQGKGLGKRLMALAETEARRKGFTHLELYTHELMVENLDLYQKWGYVETARKTEKGFNRVYMRKQLGEAERN